MSFSYIKRKLSEPEVVQIGKSNLVSHHAILNKTQELENQVTFASGYSVLILISLLLLVIVLAVIFLRRRKNKGQKIRNF